MDVLRLPDSDQLGGAVVGYDLKADEKVPEPSVTIRDCALVVDQDEPPIVEVYVRDGQVVSVRLRLVDLFIAPRDRVEEMSREQPE